MDFDTVRKTAAATEVMGDPVLLAVVRPFFLDVGHRRFSGILCATLVCLSGRDFESSPAISGSSRTMASPFFPLPCWCRLPQRGRACCCPLPNPLTSAVRPDLRSGVLLCIVNVRQLAQASGCRLGCNVALGFREHLVSDHEFSDGGRTEERRVNVRMKLPRGVTPRVERGTVQPMV